jgi:uracil phosphoribosyltransferase
VNRAKRKLSELWVRTRGKVRSRAGQVYYAKLPSDVSKRLVLLLNPIIGQ